MTRQEKTELIQRLSAALRESPGFYIIHPGDMDAAQTLAFRRKLYEKGLRMQVVKNTLLTLAMKEAGIAQVEALEPALREMTALILYKDDPKVPAQVLQNFQQETKADFPALKGAYVEETLFVGAQHLEALTRIKSKQELLGELITRLQSPMQQLISALQSGGNTLHGVLKTLSEKNS
ncbi:MAG: 50S ribosomal protein L10 [Bacteroidia bacterium]|nr:50S ribosomal protein L10 [Bacteroidia bacterium]MDW8235876.1 50S ribosomal protein L10 [Bacteroidia bacterium]